MEEMLEMIDKYKNTSPWFGTVMGYSVDLYKECDVIEVKPQIIDDIKLITSGLVDGLDEDRYASKFNNPSSRDFRYMKKPDFNRAFSNFYMERPIIFTIEIEENANTTLYFPIMKYINCVFSGVNYKQLEEWEDHLIFENCVWMGEK